MVMRRYMSRRLGHSSVFSAIQRLASSSPSACFLPASCTSLLLSASPPLKTASLPWSAPTTSAPFSIFARSFAAMAPTLPRLPVFEAIAKHDPASTVVVHSHSGRRFRYGELLGDVRRARDQMIEAAGQTDDLNGERVAFMVENSYDYVVTLLAVLAARAIAVPLSPSFPIPELQYIVDHSEALLVVSSAKFDAKAKELLASELLSKPTHVALAKHLGGGAYEKVELDEHVDAGDAGLMLYTSGTTNRPKGVSLPERVITAQAQSLNKAWEYSPTDHLLHVLPLHHIHGTINALYAPLFSGSSVEFLFPFNADAVWKRFAAPFLPETEEQKQKKGTTMPQKEIVTFFTVVPTVYSRLLATHKELSPEMQAATREAISPANLRLNISGSAALPTPVKKAWSDLSHGNVLLERFGMTEVGMALSCGLNMAHRVDGSVGWPLPSVEARLVDVDSGAVIAPGETVDSEGRERAGEIQLRGPTIFAEYWRNPTATASEFAPAAEGDANTTPWFKTGDVAVRRMVDGVDTAAAAAATPSQDWTGDRSMYFILGRKSADIIKSGGEKVSALEIERELLSLPVVAEAAVVAVPSGKWGQKVGAVVVLQAKGEHATTKWSVMDMRRALKSRLVNYKIPQLLRVVESIPRNAMGKINKKQLVAQVFVDDFSGDEATTPAPAAKVKTALKRDPTAATEAALSTEEESPSKRQKV